MIDFKRMVRPLCRIQLSKINRKCAYDLQLIAITDDLVFTLLTTMDDEGFYIAILDFGHDGSWNNLLDTYIIEANNLPQC